MWYTYGIVRRSVIDLVGSKPLPYKIEMENSEKKNNNNRNVNTDTVNNSGAFHRCYTDKT